MEEVLLPGLPLGALRGAHYNLRVLDFQRGDVVLFISDGLPELVNPQEDMLGYDAVAQCLEQHGDAGAQEILDALLELGREWTDPQTACDDITALVLKRR